MTEPLSENPEDDLVKARERLRSLRATAHSGAPENKSALGIGTADDERVRATAANGRLTNLDLDPRTMRHSPEDLGAHIATAANAALDALRAQSPSAATEPTIDPAALIQTLQAVQDQGIRQLALINQSIGEALAKARASIR